MADKAIIIEKIFSAFMGNEYPGDHFLQGSREGSEPFEDVDPFKGKTKWREIEAAHFELQLDRQSQQILYNVAMSRWR